MITWRKRIEFWIPKATNTHSQYVIRIAFPQHNGCKNAPQCCVIRTAPLVARYENKPKRSLQIKYVMLCYVMLRYVTLHVTCYMLCYMLYIMLRYIFYVICYMLYVTCYMCYKLYMLYVMLYVMFCYVMLCYVC
jgi:hypothetical protein